MDLRTAIGTAAFVRWLSRFEADLAEENRAILMALADHDCSRAVSACRAMSISAWQVGAIALGAATGSLDCAIAARCGTLRDLAPELRQLRQQQGLATRALQDLRLLISGACDSAEQLVR
ncbi:hypothetical protein [Sphingomonas arenae]|uniref:hypothetical protein n=1 Tax=Sphingomonas arenae TaxID=2812555 RepID=UPI00196739FD|nr:hypothetical protein [Sphingomonas arenae]